MNHEICLLMKVHAKTIMHVEKDSVITIIAIGLALEEILVTWIAQIIVINNQSL